MHRRADRARVFRSWFHDPCTPDEFAHHAWIPAADARLVPALERDLRLRLFSGAARRAGDVRIGTFRQGIAGKWPAWLCATGSIGLIVCGLAASPLGRDSRQDARQGGVVRAALPAPDFATLSAPAVVIASSVLIAAGLWIAASPRKHFWIVAHPVAAGRVDVWIAGVASRDAASFEREFSGFVRRGSLLARKFEPAGTGPHLAAATRGGRRPRSAIRARAFVRGAGSAART